MAYAIKCKKKYFSSESLTNPRSKSRSDLGVFLKIRLSNHPNPIHPPEKVSNKSDQAVQQKQKLSVYLNRLSICFEPNPKQDSEIQEYRNTENGF